MDEEDTRFQLLQGAVASFINASTWLGAARVIEQFPQLLQEGVPEMVRSVADQLLAEGFEAEGRAYEQCAAVLLQCQRLGTSAAIAAMERVRKLHFAPQRMETRTGKPANPALVAFMEADGLEAVRILEEHPEISSDESVERLNEYIAHFRSNGDEASARTLEKRRHLLRRW